VREDYKQINVQPQIYIVIAIRF